MIKRSMFNILIFSKRDIPCKSYQMHTLHCIRNITLCSVCDEPIPKREFDDHKQQCSASNNDTGNSCESTSKISKLNPSEHTSASSLQKSIPKEKVSYYLLILHNYVIINTEILIYLKICKIF